MRGRVAAATALAGIALGLLAPACGSDATTAPTSTTAARSTIAAGDSLAHYTRSGGLAGRRFEVVVRHDGTFEGGSGKRARGLLGGDALDELRRLVADFKAAEPEDSYGDVNPDVFATTVVAGDTATTVRTGGEPPRPVQALISFLAGLERQLPR